MQKRNDLVRLLLCRRPTNNSMLAEQLIKRQLTCCAEKQPSEQGANAKKTGDNSKFVETL